MLEKIITELINREGGYVDHPDDPGGATNYGITEAVARRNGYRGTMADMPRAVAAHIYRRVYWEAPRFDRVAQLSPAVAEELLDTGVNMGLVVAGQFFQRALNALNQQGRIYRDLKVDGLIGEITLAAFAAYLEARRSNGELVMLRALNCLQGARYIQLAERNHDLETFVFGWLLHRVKIA